MRAEHVNEVMAAAGRCAPGVAGALALAVGAARLAERLGLPLGVLLHAVVLAYDVSARGAVCASRGAP